MTDSARPSRPARSRALREVLLYGLCCGALVVLMRLVEYRLLVVGHATGFYGGLIAVVFAGVGLRLGLSAARPRRIVVVEAVPPPGPFVPDADRVRELGLTPRELEILGLVASGLSNREIAERLFVSENTVKTHTGRILLKLGAKRRTHAVRLGKSLRLIP